MLTLSDPGESSPCENDPVLAPLKPIHTVRKAMTEKCGFSLVFELGKMIDISIKACLKSAVMMYGKHLLIDVFV